MKWCLAVLALAACGAQPFAARVPDSPPRRTRIGLVISGFTASNGLRVVLVPDPNAGEVQVTMRYHVGAVDDPPGQEGMAHLVEHLMFQQVAGGQSVFARLESVATLFDGFTQQDATTYVERGRPTALAELFAVESTRLRVPCDSIGEDVFEREREIVINEEAQHGWRSGVINELLYPEGHPYHRKPPSEASLRSISRAQACLFAARHYGPRNAVLVVSGSVTEAAFKHALMPVLDDMPDHPVASPMAVPALVATGARLERPAPIRDPAVIIAWPLPADPAARAIVSTMAHLLVTLVAVESRVSPVAVEVGGDRAPMIAIVMDLPDGDAIESVLAHVRGALTHLHGAFAAKAFEHTRQVATHLLFARFEDGFMRDTVLARHVEAGREAGDGFSREIHAIGDVTYRAAQELAEHALDFDHATVLSLTPSGPVARASLAELDAPIHVAGQPRLDVDPAEASRPAIVASAPDFLLGAQTRTLANGLSVVLLPMSSVPAIEMRLVFATGTADDPTDRRGLARIAAHAIDTSLRRRDLPWLLAFYEAGGDFRVDVERDRTTYSVDGIDMYLDFLLTGLARTIRAAPDEEIARGLQRAQPVVAQADPWRVAVYGAGHPYAAPRGPFAGALDAGAVAAFRAEHFTPDNATLVIAGGFNPAIANAWIDYLFTDWSGRAVPRVATAAAVTPSSLARVRNSQQIGIEIVMPAGSEVRSRAARLVTAEMANEAVEDIRHQLGASYGVYAALVEQRLATHYEITGNIELGRAVEAIGMIRDRLVHLSAGDDVARIFVRARARVIAKLGATSTASWALASRVEHAIELGRDLHGDAAAEGAARALTLDQMTVTLRELDLGRAAIRVSGPREAVTAAFSALGRTPTFVDK